MDAPSFCKQCGNRLEPSAQTCTTCGATIEIQPSKTISPKSAVTALLLNLFLGIFGAHRFYVGKNGTGLLMLLTMGGFGIWVLVDLIFIVTNKFEDKEGRLLELTRNPSSFKTAAMVISAVVAWLLLFIIMIFTLVMYLTSGLVDAIDNQLTALRSGDIEKAYSYTSKDFQKSTSINDFKQFLKQYPSLKENQSAFFNMREVKNNTGYVQGTLTAKDGAKTPIEYRLIKEDGSWKILNIRVIPTGAGLTIKPSSDESSNNTSPNASHLSNLFEAKDNKYSIGYPDDWSYTDAGKGTILFMGKPGTAANHVNVNIQTLRSKKSGGNYSNIKDIISDLKTQLTTQASNAQILSQGEAQLPNNPKRFHGEYLVFSYNYKNQAYKQMEFIISRDDDMAYYTWAYTAPADQYDANLPVAKAMYESWKID